MKKIIIIIFLCVNVQNSFSQLNFKEVKNAQDVINNYISAIGGKDKIEKIKSETITGDLNIQGMEIGFMTFRNDTMSFIKAEGAAHGSNMLLMKSVVTASYGWEYQMNGLKDFEGEELLNKQLDFITSDIGFVLNYKKNGFEFDLKGSDTINGKPYYKLELTKDGKLLRTNYYDQESFYLTNILKPNDTSIELYDYRDVSGIYRPFKMIQKSQMELTILFKEYVFNKMIDTELLSKPSDN